MVLALFFRWCRLRWTHILIIRLRLFAVKEEKMGLRCQSSASIRHPRFLLFPLLEKGLSKKGKIGLVYRTSSWREQFSTLNDSFTITKVLCISTENVKGACYVSEIEDYLLPTYCMCSPNAASEVQSYRFCHSWRVDALHIIVYKGMLTTKRIFCYKDSLISDKVLNIEVVKTVFLRKIRDFGIKSLPLHLQTPLASSWYSVHSGTFYKL